jgi:type IV fimbrial biogenesis protein FimT
MTISLPAGGLTLIELLVALALGAILLAVAVPGYAQWIATYQVRNHAEQLAGSLRHARSEALKRGLRVNLCPAPSGRRCAAGADWGSGWLLYVDANRNGIADDSEPVLRQERPSASSVRVSVNRPLADYVSFAPLGQARLVNGGLQMGTFVVCRPGHPAIKVVLANSGRVRLESSAETCA